MLIRFLCDSDITFSPGLHKNLVTVLYFSIINLLCGPDGVASFAPQANLVYCLNLSDHMEPPDVLTNILMLYDQMFPPFCPHYA